MCIVLIAPPRSRTLLKNLIPPPCRSKVPYRSEVDLSYPPSCPRNPLRHARRFVETSDRLDWFPPHAESAEDGCRVVGEVSRHAPRRPLTRAVQLIPFIQQKAPGTSRRVRHSSYWVRQEPIRSSRWAAKMTNIQWQAASKWVM